MTVGEVVASTVAAGEVVAGTVAAGDDVLADSVVSAVGLEAL